MGTSPAARIVALEGESGIGKSRVVRVLASSDPTVVPLSEAFERLRPPPSLAVPDRRALWAVEQRLLREERTRFAAAVRERGRGHLVLADTGFLGPLTYSMGLAALDPHRDVVAPLRQSYDRACAARRLGVPDLTILLSASASTVRRRVREDPVGHPLAWRDRHARIARRERGLWTGPLARHLGARFVAVSAAGSPEAVAARVRAVWSRPAVPPPLAPEAAARRLAALLRSNAFGKR